MTKRYPALNDHTILGSTLGNALASGLDTATLVQAWYNSDTIDEFDVAVAAAGRVKLIQDGEVKV